MPGTKRNIALAAAALAGLALFVWLHFFPPGHGFVDGERPEAERTTRRTAEQAALSFAERMLGPGDWRTFAMYDANAAATGYLSKEQPETDPADVWPPAPFEFFRVAVEEAGTGTSLTVYVAAQDSRVIGWELAHRDAAALPYGTAEAAIRGLGHAPAQFALKEFDGETKVYVHRERVGDLRYRLAVTETDGGVVSVVPEVEAPAALERLLGEYELKGLLITLSTLLGSLALAIAAIAFAAVWRKEMAFRRGIWLTLFYFLPLAVYTAGLYPALRLETPFLPAGALFGVLLQQGVNMLNAAVVWLSLVAGEGLWRKMGFRLWPDMGDPAFGPAAKRGVWLGYLYAFVILGVQAVVLYAGVAKFGVWYTADPLSDGRNQLFLASYPLLAWTAAISEEAIYRLFAIACITLLIQPVWRWVHRWTGRPVFLNPLFSIAPAVFLSSLLWGAAHVGYSVYPVYTRLIEVTMLGFLFAWILLRHGLIAAIFAHAAVDLIWMGIDLAFNNGQCAALGLLYLATPIAAGYAAALLATRSRPRGAPAP